MSLCVDAVGHYRTFYFSLIAASDPARRLHSLNCAYRARLQLIPPSSLVISPGMGLIDLPLRAAFSPAHPQARRDMPLARARAFHPLYLSLGEWPRLPFTARIERAQFHRARSASKKGTWLLHLPFQA